MASKIETLENQFLIELISKMLSNRLEISSFQEIQKIRKHVFNLVKYTNFKHKIKEI